MAVLNGLPPRFETIITALDAIGDDDASLRSTRFEVVFSRRRGGQPCIQSLRSRKRISFTERPQDPSGTPNKKSGRTVAGQTTPNNTAGRSMGVRLVRIENRKGRRRRGCPRSSCCHYRSSTASRASKSDRHRLGVPDGAR